MSRQLRLSKEFGKRFSILGRLGRGGAGMVFKADQRDLRRRVAIKLVDPELFSDRITMQRFAQEAEITARLQHPNVLTVFEAGVDAGPDGDVPYIVYEMVDGSDLGTVLEKAGGKLEPDRALSIICDVLAGLEVAHQHDPEILHRDIKPDNVLISSDGVVKLADFGIAKRRGTGPKTETGMVVGTPTYMSPEQAQGLPLTATSDLYSTGVMLFECLCGRPPFTAASGMEVAVMHVRDPAPPPSRFDLSIPPEADEILLRVLQKGPLDRFPDAGSFRNQLEGARKAWAVWTKRAATGERAVGPVSLSSSAEVRTAPTEARRPAARAPVATRALEASSPDPIPLATRGISAPIDPGKSQHERVMLAGIGSLLALGVGGALFLSGALSSGAEDPGAEDALMAPINLRIEAGATAATVRWESKVEYPSVVRVREDGSRRDGVRVQRTDEDGQPAAPTRQHQVDVDGLEPGVEYQVVVVFPGSRRSLPRKFETPKIRFLDYPHAELSGGKLRVRWRTNLPARGLVKARVVVQGRKSAEERRHDTRVYSRDGEATLPGFRREDTIQFRVLLYSEWWDQQIARDVGRVGPEVHTDWFELASRILKDRAAKDQVAAVLRDLPERPAEPWPLPGDDGYQALVERLAASFKDAQFARLRSEFQPGLEGFFSSEEVDWVERRNWYQDVARFDDWLYGLEARLVRVPFQARSLYPPGWRPLGETSVLRRGGAFVEQAEVRFVDGEDPDFDSTVGSGRKPVAVTFEAPGARGWARAEFGVKVEGLPPGSAVTADFGRGLRFRLRPQEDGAAARPLGSSGGAWLFHEVPPALLGPGTVFGAVGLYTAPGVPVGGRAKILAAEVRGQRASR